MRVFLIRHGETVDNIASLYAGSRDSELTNHGVQQATRLGQFFASSDVRLSHIYSSHLKRAVLTAKLIRDAQPVVRDGDDRVVEPFLKQVRELAEQDFGSYEGVSFLARDPASKLSGKELHRSLHKDDPGFVDVELREAMIARVDVFLDGHLAPIVNATASQTTTALQGTAVAIVSHGILLSVLWRRLLTRLPPRSVVVHHDVVARNGNLDLERLGGWSNTGYLELDITSDPVITTSSAQLISPPAAIPGHIGHGVKSSAKANAAATEVAPQLDDLQAGLTRPVAVGLSKSANPRIFETWRTTVCAVNSRQHLQGLKRTGGGVGSSKHDAKQRTIDSFFKRRKVGR